jgi:3-hydroxyisobutyrate dehydrogenase
MTKVGWIGTGVMGAAMCGHVMEAGRDVRVYSRTKSRAEPLVERGAEWCDSPRALADGCEVVFTMVGTPDDVRDVVLGEDGVLGAMQEGSTLVDLTTSEPGLAEEIAAAAAERGVGAVDAPVSGGDVGARKGELVVMAGGEESAIEAVRPLVECFSRVFAHHGPAGAGQHTKMVNQILIAGGMVSLCEGLEYAQRAGLDPRQVVETVSGGAAGSWSLSNYGPRILDGDFEPGFMVDHYVKDLGIALTEARGLKLSLPGLALAQQLYVATQAGGQGDRGTHSLIDTIRRLSPGAD